jgi:predicted AlkP superfamily pyrophosphatase or phosphodiesterase
MLLAELSLIGQNKKAIFILLDGIPADVIENTATPYLDQIAAQGGYTRAFVGGEKGGASESPTISAVGYNSLLTGTWANKHNVWGNSIKASNYDFPTIFRVAKDYNSNLKTAVFSTWLDNRTKLIGEGLEATRNIQMDFAFDGFELDTLRFPHDEERDYIRQIDELVVNKTADYIAESSPDLSWVYLEYTDDMGHRYGDSDQMTAAVKLADDQVGRIWKAIQQREKENAEEWMIVITTDHGRTADTGKGHGGQSERERTTWIVTNQSNLTPAFFNQPGIVDIMPSICDFMGIEITEKVKANLYGKSFLK